VGQNGPVTVAGVIDNWGQAAQNRIASLRRGPEPVEVRFVVATHPHQDHVENLWEILELAHGTNGLAQTLWWGGIDARLQEEYCEALYRELQGDLRKTAREVLDFISRALFCSGEDDPVYIKGPAPPRPFLKSTLGGKLVFQTKDVEGKLLRIWSVGPWAGPQTGYRDDFNRLFVRRGGQWCVTSGSRVRANRTSIALLVEYGESQVLLGGDMERESWLELEQQWPRVQRDAIKKREPVPPPLKPCLIKVSHHGSETADAPGMWPGELKGFYGGGVPAWCVVTPWRTARKNPAQGKLDRFLPKANLIAAMCGTGCRVVETGQPVHGGITAIERACGMFFPKSNAEFSVPGDAVVHLASHVQCKIHSPKE